MNVNQALYNIVCFPSFRLREAELSLTGIYNPINPKLPTAIAAEFGSIAGVALQLLGKIYRFVSYSMSVFCILIYYYY